MQRWISLPAVFPALLLITSPAFAQHKGDVPPALVWDRVKGSCPANLDWRSLQGQVVVISIGAEDVFPQDVAEWNEVPQELRGEPVTFVQVVSGSEFLLDQALARTAFIGCVVFDSNATNRTTFKLPAFPRTVVVDQSGLIAGYSRGGPDADDIRSVLFRKVDTGLNETPPQPKPYDSGDVQIPPSYEVHIAPALPNELRVWGEEKTDTYILQNQPLKVAVLDLWNTPLARISFPKELAQRNYNVTAHIPVADRELLVRLVRDAIQKQLGLRIESETQTEQVYLLTGIENHVSVQRRAAGEDERGMTGGGEGSIIGTAQTMPDIARTFEDLLNVPVLDETGLQGKYDYQASSTLPESQRAFDLAGQLGLRITPSDRPIPMLVVRKAN